MDMKFAWFKNIVVSTAGAASPAGEWSSPGLNVPEDENLPKFFKTDTGIKVQVGTTWTYFCRSIATLRSGPQGLTHATPALWGAMHDCNQAISRQVYRCTCLILISLGAACPARSQVHAAEYRLDWSKIIIVFLYHEILQELVVGNGVSPQKGDRVLIDYVLRR